MTYHVQLKPSEVTVHTAAFYLFASSRSTGLLQKKYSFNFYCKYTNPPINTMLLSLNNETKKNYINVS